jgi:hypothetical protein
MLYLARKWRCHRMLLMGLAMARTVYDAPLPRSVQHTIMADPDIPSLIKRMPKGLLQRTEEGIDETDAEALCLLLKDSSIERYRYSLALCRAKSPIVTKSLPWFRLQDRLQTLAQWFPPFHEMANQCVRLWRIAKCLPRWRVLPG